VQWRFEVNSAEMMQSSQVSERKGHASVC